MQPAGERPWPASPRARRGPTRATSCSAWAAATSISVVQRAGRPRTAPPPRARRPACRRPRRAAGSRRERDHRHAVGARQLGQRAARRDHDPPGAERARPPRSRRASPRCRPSSWRTARSCRASSTAAARSRACTRIGREAWSPSAARASAPPIAEPPMPATTSPPGVSVGMIGRLHPPQRVAQVLGQGEHVAQLSRWSRPRRSPRGSERGTSGSSAVHQNVYQRSARAGSSHPGRYACPRVRTLSAPTVTPSPSTTPPSIWRASPIFAAGRDDAVAQRAPAPISVPPQDHRALDVGAGADASPRRRAPRAAHLRARRHLHAGPEHRGRDGASSHERVGGRSPGTPPRAARSTAVRTSPSMMSKVPCR